MQTLADWDHAVLHWINSHHTPVLDWLLLGVSTCGEVGALWFAVGLGLIIFGRGRARITGVLLIATIIITDRLVGAPLGGLLHRARPYADEPGLRQLGVRWGMGSFPSAHAHSVVIATLLLGTEYRRLLPYLIVFALLSLYARPYLGMHHPLDVLAGMAMGAVTGTLAVLIRRRFWPRAE